MNDKGKAFWLGLFIILALGLAAWLILFLKPGAGDGGRTLTVRFSNINKVTEGTRVTYGGKPVGEVKEIRQVSDPRKAPIDADGNLYFYELTLSVDSSVKIYTYDEIIFATSGLLGEKSIAIIPKAPPPGAAPAKEVTNEILYAQSTDQLELALHTLTRVAETFQNTLESVSAFLETNSDEFHTALNTFNNAAEKVHTFMDRANETDVTGKAAVASDKLITAMTKAENFFQQAEEMRIIERMGRSFDALHSASNQLTSQEGTLGRLLNSDCAYVQFTTVLSQLQAILYDIQTYGILYQFDRKWQRCHDLRRCCTEKFRGP